MKGIKNKIYMYQIKFKESILSEKIKNNYNNFYASFLCQADEYVFLIDEIHSSIIRVSKENNKINYYDNLGFKYPTSMIFDNKQYLYLTDRWNHRVCKLDLECKLISSFGTYGKKQGMLAEPFGIAYFDKNIYIVERNNHRTSVFNDKGEFKHCFGYAGPKKTYYESKAFKTGYVYESWIKQSNKFNSIETNFFSSEYIIGIFYMPKNICIYNNNIFVSDTGNNRIQIFDINNKYINSINLHENYYPTNINVINEVLYICSEKGTEIYLYNLLNNKLNNINLDNNIIDIKFINNKMIALDFWNKKIFEIEVVLIYE